MIFKNKKNRGFVILYAVIITTVVLIVGVSLMNIMTKQLVLSSISRNAKISYYAALAGRNCAEFWKNIVVHENTDGSVVKFFNNSTNDKIVCIGNTEISGSDFRVESNSPSGVIETHFNFDIDIKDGPRIIQTICAKVMVRVDDNVCDANKLLITSEGYNDSCSNVDSSNPNPRLVRSIYADKKSKVPPCE